MNRTIAIIKWVFGLACAIVGSVSLAGVDFLPAWVLQASLIAGPVLLAVEGYIKSTPFPSGDE